jgi:predicted aminopeptidase
MKRRTAVYAIALLALLAGCSPGYVLRAGLEQAKILARREPIERVMENPATDEETRRRLGLVLQARNFAEHSLGLNAGDSYTTYSWVESDTLLMVVSGSRRDRFEPYTWWFPIVGRVPYKGYFDFGRAWAEAESLERAGFDSYVRPAGAFSTLGWFNDPLLNTMLRYSDVDLVNTVIHELLHATIFIPGQVALNESFASYVGDRGAIEFFCAREGEASERCVRARGDWEDRRLFGRFLTGLVTELETLYARGLPLETVLVEREHIFEAARRRFHEEVEPELLGRGYRWIVARPMNNATLIGVRLYYQRLDLFEDVFRAMGGDLVGSIEAISQAARARPGDPFAAVEALLAGG